MPIRVLVATLLVVQLSACSLFGHKRGCEGADCYAPRLLEHNNTAHKWYCYGQKSGSWDCLDQPNKNKIVAVEPQLPANPDEGPGADTRVATAKQVVVKPLTNITRSVLDQPDDSYAVQLTASHSEKDLADFAQEHDVTNPVYVIVPGENGPTYILILGIYKDQDKAIDAREAWERARRLGEEPWVRKLGPLQKAIKAKDKDD